MLFESHCKLGKIQVDEAAIQVVAPFKKVIWSAPRNTVTRITQKPTASILMLDLTIHTTQGLYEVPSFIKRHLKKLLALFPDVEVVQVGQPGSEWYTDSSRLTYIGTYTDDNQLQREVESAALNGWFVQSTAGTGGHVNVGRTATVAALTGGVSLLFGASRSKDKITVTFGRTSEWIAQHR